MLDAAFDGGFFDGEFFDGDATDGQNFDASSAFDSGLTDGATDSSGDRDTGASDGSIDAGTDVGVSDAGTDAGSDGGASSGDCISGATGTHALRFTWQGSSSGSVAYVGYDVNELPDNDWRVTAASSSIGYRPIFRDPFLGEGGLELSGTVFIDVEMSTVGLSSIRNATLAIYGRSYNTTTSGSFTWQTFEGTGASERGSVSNSAPYEWYQTDATAAFAPGDDGIRLRLRAGPPSGALIVRRVEICFDAT